MLNNSNLSIVVLSYDGFEELWKPFFDHFFTSWPDCPYNVYLVTNFLNFDDERVISLKVGADISWSSSLKIGLEKISSDWILFFYDDTFIEKIDFENLNSSFEFLSNYKPKSLVLRPNLFISSFYNSFRCIKIPKNSLYRNALFSNIFNREYLNKILVEGESAWDFEIKGNVRSQGEIFYSVNKPVFKYKHGIVKGIWLPDTLNYLNKKGYSFNKLNKSYNFYKSFKISILNRLFYLYYKMTPKKALIFIEKKRLKI